MHAIRNGPSGNLTYEFLHYFRTKEFSNQNLPALLSPQDDCLKREGIYITFGLTCQKAYQLCRTQTSKASMLGKKSYITGTFILIL